MKLGRRLHELWRMRVGLIVSLVLATVAALWSVQEISLFPPGLQARPLELSTASTRALVDTPRSTLLNLEVNTNDFAGITSRALLIANVMGSAPVREYIAQRAGVRADLIQIATPVTPDWPRPIVRADDKSAPTDIAKSPEAYRLSLLSNPTVPVIEVFATAPSPAVAARLANGAIQGTQDYLRALALRQGIPPAQQARLQQLGDAKGGTINAGANIKVAALSFFVVLLTCSATTLFISRVRRGWQLEGMAHASHDVRA